MGDGGFEQAEQEVPPICLQVTSPIDCRGGSSSHLSHIWFMPLCSERRKKQSLELAPRASHGSVSYFIYPYISVSTYGGGSRLFLLLNDPPLTMYDICVLVTAELVKEHN